MANIELVIKIPEELYKEQLSSNWIGNIIIHDAIVNGTLLPKGHGRLIDENDLDGEYICSLGDSFECVSYRSCSECTSSEWRWNSDVSDAPTIIEADN